VIPAGWAIAAKVVAPAIVIGVALAAYWAHGVRERRAGVEEGRAEVLARWTADVNESNRRAALAGDRYTRWQARQAPKIITRAVEVNRALDANDEARSWAAGVLPAGVRDAIERAAADSGAGEPDASLSRVPATGVADAR
jgi:hypothetical protein